MPELALPVRARVRWRIGVALRPAEWIGVTYFVYTAVLSLVSRESAPHLALAFCLPLVISVVAAVEAAHSRPWTRMFRALFPTALILVAYRQLDWFHSSPLINLQHTWVSWDRYLLQDCGLRAGIEAFGVLGPLTLETSYLLLYVIPPLSVVFLVASGRGDRVDRYLMTLLGGTLAAYALMPFFPTVSPRVAFPNDLLPLIETPIRAWNIYVLDHMDITTAVFPSGHVAVVFSSAWGIWQALPERRWLAWVSLCFALLVFLATVYGRYHYAVDGLASVVLSVAAWRLTQLYDRST